MVQISRDLQTMWVNCAEFVEFAGYVGELSEFRLICWNFREFSATGQAVET